MPRGYSEDSLVEQPAIELFQELGWEAANCYHETFGKSGFLSRETAAEVVLTSRLRSALEKLNPDVPSEAIESAIEQLTRVRSAMSSVQANRDIYHLMKNGIRVDLSGSAKRKKDRREYHFSSGGRCRDSPEPNSSRCGRALIVRLLIR